MIVLKRTQSVNETNKQTLNEMTRNSTQSSINRVSRTVNINSPSRSSICDMMSSVKYVICNVNKRVM